MDNLLIETKLTLDSREVAEMVGKRHANLLRDIEMYIGYIDIDQNSKLSSDDFFSESSYESGTGKNYKCYKVTIKGCEMIANKLTGQKGVLFTATYINRFHELKEKKLQRPQSQLDILRMAIDQIEIAQKEAKEAKQIAQNIKDTLIHTDEDWRNWVNEQLNKIAFQNKNYRELRKQSYDILENRARCRLNVRLNNLRDRLRETGATETKISQANYLDVIENSTRLKEIYTNIVEKIVIKYST